MTRFIPFGDRTQPFIPARAPKGAVCRVGMESCLETMMAQMVHFLGFLTPDDVDDGKYHHPNGIDKMPIEGQNVDALDVIHSYPSA